MSRLVRFGLMVVFVLASLPVLPAMAAACTWTGATNLDWATAGNWSSCGGGVPGSGDTVTIGSATNQPVISTTTAIAGLTINSSATLTINSGATLTVSGAVTLAGTVGGSGNLTVNGSLAWTGGTMSGSGVTTIAPGGTLSIGGSYETLDGRTLNQGGTATWTGTGEISFADGAVFNNQAGASLDAQNNAGMYFGGSGATPAFNNAGLFRKSVTSGTTYFSSVPFNNTGTVSVTLGTLQLSSGGMSSGAFTVAAGATLDFYGGTHNLDASSSVSGAGTVRFSGATVNVTGAYNVTGLTQVSYGSANLNNAASTTQLALSNGTLGGSGVLTVTSMSWTGGTMSGSGVTTIALGGTLSIGGSYETLDGRTLNQGGTATWTGTGEISFSNGAVFNNQAGASLDAQNNAGMYFGGSGATPAFNNAGLFRKSVASGTTYFSSVPFNNTGTVSVTLGTLQLNSGGTSSGAFAVAAGAILDFHSGTHNLDASSSVSGAGTISFSGATVNISGAYNVTGLTQVSYGSANLNNAASTTQLALSNGTLGGSGVLTVTSMSWTGGTMSGSGVTTIAPGGTLSIGGSYETLDGRTLNQGGTATWTGTGEISFSNGAVFNNQAGASLDAQNNASMYFGGSGAAPAFNNAGVFTKSVASGTTYFSSVPFNNTGTVSVTMGTLQLSSGGMSSGAFAVAAGAILDFHSGTHNLDASSSVSGAGTISFSGATMNISGAYNVTGLTQVSYGSANLNNAANTTQLLLSGGTLGGTGVVTTTSLTWTGGTMSGSGVTTIAPGGTLSIGGSYETLDGRTLNQGGTATWTGTGEISFSNGAVFNNQAGASLDAQNNASMYFGGSGATPAFNNAGVFTKSVASGTTYFSSVPFKNTGTVDVQSGKLQFSSFVQTAGATLLNGGSLASFSDPINIQGGSLSGTGTVDADITNAGHVAPGGNASPGNIVVTRDYVQTAAGSLDIDIGGPTAVTQYDRLDITGQATINGSLNVTLINGYVVPTVAGTSFRVMNYGSHSGTFVTTTGLDMGNGKFLLPMYTTDHMIVVLPYHVYLPVTLR